MELLPPAPDNEGTLYARYILGSLDRLMECISALDAEQFNWHPPVPGANSVYALTVHTISNAEENILSTLGGQGSTRDRDREFMAQAPSVAALRMRWQDVRQRLQEVLRQLSAADLECTIHHPRRGAVTGREVLLVVARHAAEHLGQADLTRDLAQALMTGR